jgi:hypothetical protein
MQCPTCGKEAINVNGRYVCLDCGVEISPDGTTAGGTPAANDAPAVDNHTQLPTGSVPPIAPSEDQIPTAAPVMPTESPVVVPQAETAEPVIPEVPAFPEPPAASIPETPLPVTSEPEPTTEVKEPVKDYYMDTIGQNSSETDAPVGESIPAGTIPPDFPEPTTEAPSEPAVTPVETPAEPEPAPDLTNLSPVEPSLSMDSEFNAASGADSAPIEPPVPTLTEATVPSDPSSQPGDSFFQPSSIDIMAPQTPVVPPVEPVSDIAPTTVDTTFPSVEPTVAPNMDIETPLDTPVSMPEPVVAPESPAPAAFEEGPVVDPLDTISPEAPAQTPPPVAPPAFQPQGSFPGTTNIPSAESVFGAPATESSDVVLPKKPNLLWLWITLGVLGFLLVLGGGIFIYTSFFGKSSQAGVSQNNSGELLTISQDVAGAMDASTDVALDYNQSVDFSKVTPKDSSQALFFSKPKELKGIWAVDKEENISYQTTKDAVVGKRVFMTTENATYVFSNDTKAWVKTDGQNFSPSSIFFPADTRGGLFYLSKVEKFENQGTETVDGKDLKKIKVVLKQDVLKDFLSSIDPALAKAKYSSIKADNLKIIALVEDSGQIAKITVSGDVDVNSDIYTGPVTLNATGVYKYEAQTVTKPI